MVTIIAEAGVNHNGDEKLAFQLVDFAHEAGADIVKFQTFKAKNLATEGALQANYQANNTGKLESQLSMLARLELPYDAHYRLVEHCAKLGIEFLSTAFDAESLDFLANGLGLKRLKIPSGEITNAPLVLAHARTGRDLIISTGMSTLGEIEAALGVVAFGYTISSEVAPSIQAFQAAYVSEAGKKALKDKITLLHCTTEYPAPLAEINLRAMNTLGSAFGFPVGYSDHSEGNVIAVAAVARGAVLIEKHFTLDKQMEGPDHKASLDPKELADMIQAIRNVELALGDGIKAPYPSELRNQAVARKSIIAARDITAGRIFTSDDLTTKRPGNGQSPYDFWKLLTMVSSKDYKAGELIDE